MMEICCCSGLICCWCECVCACMRCALCSCISIAIPIIVCWLQNNRTVMQLAKAEKKQPTFRLPLTNSHIHTRSVATPFDFHPTSLRTSNFMKKICGRLFRCRPFSIAQKCPENFHSNLWLVRQSQKCFSHAYESPLCASTSASTPIGRAASFISPINFAWKSVL